MNIRLNEVQGCATCLGTCRFMEIDEFIALTSIENKLIDGKKYVLAISTNRSTVTIPMEHIEIGSVFDLYGYYCRKNHNWKHGTWDIFGFFIHEKF